MEEALEAVFLLWLDNILPPLILLFGQRVSQDANAEALRNFVKSLPTSPNIACTVSTPKPGILVKSTPYNRCNSVLRGFSQLPFDPCIEQSFDSNSASRARISASQSWISCWYCR